MHADRLGQGVPTTRRRTGPSRRPSAEAIADMAPPILYSGTTREAPMHTTYLRKVGGAVMLAVPATLLDVLNLGVGAKVTIGIEDGRIVVAPGTRPSSSRNATTPLRTTTEIAHGSTPRLSVENYHCSGAMSGWSALIQRPVTNDREPDRLSSYLGLHSTSRPEYRPSSRSRPVGASPAGAASPIHSTKRLPEGAA